MCIHCMFDAYAGVFNLIITVDCMRIIIYLSLKYTNSIIDIHVIFTYTELMYIIIQTSLALYLRGCITEV